MTSVTGLTAARMAATEDAAIVGAHISVDNLILEREDGGTINAGNVRGPTGITPVAGTWTPTWGTIVPGTTGAVNLGTYTYMGGANSGDTGLLTFRVSMKFGTAGATLPTGSTITCSTPSAFNMLSMNDSGNYMVPIGDAAMALAGTPANAIIGKIVRSSNQAVELRYMDPTTRKLLIPTSTQPHTWATTATIDFFATVRVTRV